REQRAFHHRAKYHIIQRLSRESARRGQPTAGGGFMAVRGEDVASSIEAHVREAIERMVGEIRSSVEDVRGLVDQQLKAALQSVQADVKSITFLPHIQKSIGELEHSLAAEKPPAAPAVADATRVKRAVQ